MALRSSGTDAQFLRNMQIKSSAIFSIIVMPPAKLSITLSVYKTISIAESDLFLQKMTKKSDLLAANHFFKVHLSLAI